jgi:hypothetical protein
MKLRIIDAFAAVILTLGAMGLQTQTTTAQQKFETKPVAEKKLKELPAGPLYWQVENYPTLGEAQAAEGPTSLIAEVAGKPALVARPMAQLVEERGLIAGMVAEIERMRDLLEAR